MSITFGAEPTDLGITDLAFEEYMHFMYLPVLIPEMEIPTAGCPGWHVQVPDQLDFARKLIGDIVHHEICHLGSTADHVYVTARRGFATPGNPLNRPGWHSDGFGTTDVNYVWTDAFPTWFAVQPFEGISTDHIESARQFEQQIDPAQIRTYPDRTLMRLDPSVIHAAPEIPAPGGERSFFKVSFAHTRYNLRGNARNHLIDYDWPMFDRAALRNDPAHAALDGVPA